MPGPLHALIARKILMECIKGPALEPGDRLPTVRELRTRYEVSMTTIMHALDLLQKQGVIHKRHGSGSYVAPPPDAPRPVWGRQGQATLGFVTTFRGFSEVESRIYEGVEAAAKEMECRVVTVSHQRSYATEREQVTELLASGCQGIVLYPIERTPAELADDYLNREFLDAPIVLVDLGQPVHQRTQIVMDNHQAAFEVTRHLLEKGHRRIALTELTLSDGRRHRAVEERKRGYLAALQAYGLQPRPEDIWPVTRTNQGVEDMDAQVAALSRQRPDTRPTALITVYDVWAISAIQAAQSVGLRVPDDLQVIGFDNLELGRSIRPPFPTTAPDFEQMGRLAARCVIQQIQEGVGAPATYLLPVALARAEFIVTPTTAAEVVEAH